MLFLYLSTVDGQQSTVADAFCKASTKETALTCYLQAGALFWWKYINNQKAPKEKGLFIEAKKPVVDK